ncbi:MAG: glycosyltransferase family 4 protein [Acidimicrobiia bacterium]|nr:glycosyltransferase family 4 protein [Acidimicrobiia bacterium]
MERRLPDADATGATEPLRVALDATPLFGARTGVGMFTMGVLDALADRPDLEVVAYAVTWRGRGEVSQMLPSRRVRPARSPMAARPLRWAWMRWNRPPIEWWTDEVDVVHGTNFVVPPTREAGEVVTVHDLTPLRFPELAHEDTLAYVPLIKRALERGAHVHTPSTFIAEEVVEHFGVDRERVHAVAEGIPALPDVAADEQVAGGAPYILTIGTVEPRKDHPLLVRAFDAVAGDIPDLHLVIAGGDGWGTAALADAMAAAKHRDRIVRLGYVDDEARAGLLNGATLFAFPSVYEGFGLPPLEAMRAGVPVVATAAGALPEVLDDAAVIVPVGDVDALADALRRAVLEGALRTRLVAAGRLRVEGYSWARCAEGLVDVYRRVRPS